MRHYSEDELILHYYGEPARRDRVERHLEVCEACAATYRDIAATLALVGQPDVPERDERYGLEVWQRIRHRLPDPEAPWWAAWMQWNRLAWSAGVALLIVASFVAGRSWPRPDREVAVPAAANEAPAESSERVRLAAITDHLDQSERVLLDLVNAPGETVDVRDQQAWAADLIDANRLYRDASERAGDETVAGVLDELERHLLEIVHGPATLAPAELNEIRVRLEAAALLFKVRVLSDELRERELAPTPPRKTT